jgi:CHAT domain-containing protein
MSNEPKAGKGIDPEMLAAYIDNRLPPEQRAAVEAQLATDPESYALLVDTLEALDDDEIKALEVKEPLKQPMPFAPKSPKSPFRKWMIAGGALAAAAAILLVVWTQPDLLMRLRGQPAVDPRVERLVAAVGEERYLEARLTGGFKYGPLRSTSRGAGDLASQNLALLAAAGELQKEAEHDQSARTLRAWGVSQLLLRNEDAAIESLDSATMVDPSCDLCFSDLAAALVTRFQRNAAASDLPRGIEAAERALELNPGLVEAAFTRALALELMPLRESAIRSWNEYLQKDQASPWAAEARRRLAALESASPRSRWQELRDDVVKDQSQPGAVFDVVAEFPEEIPDLLLGHVLPAWATARMNGVSDPPQLVQAIAIARRHAELGGDRTFADVLPSLAFLDSEQLAGVQALGEGTRALERDRYQDAHRALIRARPALATQPLLAGWTDFKFGRTLFYNNQTNQALALAQKVAAAKSTSTHPQLAARATWLSGLIRFTLGNYADARRDYERAVELFAQASEPRGAGTAFMNLSVLFRFFGDRERAWHFRLRGLHSLPRHRPELHYGFLTSTAISASLDRFPRVALRVMDEAVLAADDSFENVRTEARLQRARLRSRAGQPDDAMADMATAAGLLGQIQDTVSRGRIRDALNTAGAEVYLHADPRRALQMGDSAATEFANRGDDLRSAELAVYRGRAHVRLGDRDGGLRQIDAGIQNFERVVSTLPLLDPVRLSSMEPVWELFDENFVQRLGAEPLDRPEAFAAYEASRARTLIEVSRANRLTWDQARARLSSDVTLVLLHQREVELVVWTIRQTEDWVIRVPWTRSDSERFTNMAVRQLSRGRSSASAGSIRKELLRDALRSTPVNGTVVIVPDSPFHRLPWSALPDAANRPLVERVAVAVSPSVSTALSDEYPPTGQPPSALIVSAARSSPDHAVLGAVDIEARSLKALYPSAGLLMGTDATPRALLASLSKHEVVHVAAHAIDSPVYPMLSRLLLADGGGANELTAAQIMASGAKPGSLVVIATCSSIGATAARGEGAVGLAWSFLMAGASTVVGSLWEIDDARSVALFVDLHKGVLSGLAPAAALRRAQLNAIANSVPPSEWAALQVVGHP